MFSVTQLGGWRRSARRPPQSLWDNCPLELYISTKDQPKFPSKANRYWITSYVFYILYLTFLSLPNHYHDQSIFFFLQDCYGFLQSNGANSEKRGARCLVPGRSPCRTPDVDGESALLNKQWSNEQKLASLRFREQSHDSFPARSASSQDDFAELQLDYAGLAPFDTAAADNDVTIFSLSVLITGWWFGLCGCCFVCWITLDCCFTLFSFIYSLLHLL